MISCVRLTAGKPAKDPNAPKKPLSAFMIFSNKVCFPLGCSGLNQHQCPPVWDRRVQHAACIYFASLASGCAWCQSSSVLGSNRLDNVGTGGNRLMTGCGCNTRAHNQVREDVRAKSPDLSFGETGGPCLCLLSVSSGACCLCVCGQLT